jgi:hypothetical protein
VLESPKYPKKKVERKAGRYREQKKKYHRVSILINTRDNFFGDSQDVVVNVVGGLLSIRTVGFKFLYRVIKLRYNILEVPYALF